MEYDKLLVKKYGREIIANIILLMSMSILSIIGPLIMRSAVDYTLKWGIEKRSVMLYALVLLLLYIVKFIYQRFRYWFAERFKNIETVKLYEKVFQMKYEKIIQLEPTYIVERINTTVSTIFELYSTSLAGIFVSALTVIMILFIVFRIDNLLGILFVVQIPLQYLGFRKLLNGEKSKLSKLSEKLQIVSAKNNKDIKAIMSDVINIKQFEKNSKLFLLIQKKICEINQAEREGNTYAMETCTVLDFIMVMLKNMAYIYIVVLFAIGQAEIGDLIYLNLVNNLYFDSISDVIEIQINLRNLRGSMKFVKEEIDSNKEADGNVQIHNIDLISMDIRNLGYDTKVLVREGKLEIKKGDVVSISGESGCGKSTLVKTFNKLLTADGLSINGIEADKIKNASLRKCIFYLSQDAYLLPLTIRENIELGIDVSEEEMQKLMKADFMRKVISDEKWLDKKITENAANLSGGDRQRIILGRIFLRDPEVIILDESFNSLDEDTGLTILKQIIDMYSERIIIIISHSNTYLQYCNKKYEIRNGVLQIVL